uniref:FtsH_ext domain-containing protein n=1 Tax=Panagrellus redivivus TaxID=6233 RepID=A0A7E4UYT9_PANRE
MLPSRLLPLATQLQRIPSRCCQVYALRFTSHNAVLSRLSATAVGNVQAIRLLRTRGSSSSHSHDSHENKSESENKSSEDSSKGNSDLPPEFQKIEESALKKLRLFSIFVVITTFGMSFLFLGNFTKHTDPHIVKALANKDNVIDFDLFLQEFLKTGEVTKIIYFPEQSRAVAILQPGAIILGQPYPQATVSIKFDREVGTEQRDQFRLEVRHAEEKLGIPLSEAVPIEVFRSPSLFKLVEIGIAFTLLGFLGFQYGRLLRRTVLQKRAEAAARAKKQ